MRNKRAIRPRVEDETDSRSLRRARRALLSCSFCRPHRGENACRHRDRKRGKRSHRRP